MAWFSILGRDFFTELLYVHGIMHRLIIYSGDRERARVKPQPMVFFKKYKLMKGTLTHLRSALGGRLNKSIQSGISCFKASRHYRGEGTSIMGIARGE